MLPEWTNDPSGRFDATVFSNSEYCGKRKSMRREVVLAEMDRVVSWKNLLALI